MKMKRIISLLLVVILLPCVCSAIASEENVYGIWKCIRMTRAGVYTDLAESGYAMYFVAMPDGVAYLHGGTADRPSSSQVTYETDQMQLISVILPDGTRENGFFTESAMILENSDGITSIFEKEQNIFPNVIEAKGLEDFYGNWIFSWAWMQEEPYIVNPEILELNDRFDLNMEMEIDENSLYFIQNEQDALFHSYLSSGSLMTEEMSTVAFKLTDSGEIQLALDNATYYFKKKAENTAQSNAPSSGVRVDFIVNMPENLAEFFDLLSGYTIRTVRSRLDGEGLQDVQFSCDENGVFHAEIPSSCFVDGDYQYIINLITAPGEISFLDPNGKVFMTDEMIQSAEYWYDSDIGNHCVKMKFTDEGTTIFGEYTTKYFAEHIQMFMDGECLIDAVVNAPITDGICIITGNYTRMEAKAIASKISSGRLPLPLTVDQVETWTE